MTFLAHKNTLWVLSHFKYSLMCLKQTQREVAILFPYRQISNLDRFKASWQKLNNTHVPVAPC